MVSRASAFVAGLLRGYQARVATWCKIGFALAWAGLIWWGSEQTSGPPGASFFSAHVWNLGHVVFFGVLASLLLLSTQGCTVRAAVCSVFLTTLYGVVDEWHQSHVEGRSVDAWDVGSDAMGACIASSVLLWMVAGKRRAARLLWVFVPLAAGTVHMASGTG